MAGIYLHIPFCKQACSYCNFYFLTRDQLRQPFVDALIEEIKSYRDKPFSAQKIRTIYFGGGTPSLLTSAQLSDILTVLDDVFDVESDETTIEMNPDDVSKEYLHQLKNLGFTRVSMGVQSFDPDLLSFMNRAHTKDEAVRALELIRETGFSSFTADLIYGNPGQSLQALEKDIDRLLSFDPPHISAYSLTIEPKTRLGKQVELGRIQPPEDDTVEAHFTLVQDKLRMAGLQRYEVSNFSKPGKEAVHNSNYWKHVNYLGLGPSAHSLLWNKNGARRWRNRPDIKPYLEKNWDSLQDEVEDLTLTTLAEERLMLGLRTVSGITTEELSGKYGYKLNDRQRDWLRIQEERNCVFMQKIDNEQSELRLTEKGLKLADYIVLELISRGEN
ncbi:radical SAM family heme chaperone HemW [Rhodohalobacter sp. SW132]|uniref:radical SAM family heme chaperone HemW n=1 Tax=Rhodohalobacter sp. SW132 TaxID=2293433 RepID=UPI000E24D7D0|nr:radical SAM family heme chaperone HemW [Rhodohalobacter sp. SW132]REL38872.1 radical SAM family heme chaperone HemW [Rhodohalobacter sp. SW132]